MAAIAKRTPRRPHSSPRRAALGRRQLRLETLEQRQLLAGDIGDTFATAEDTQLDPILGGVYSLATELGDGTTGNRDLDQFRFDAVAGTQLTITTSAVAGGTNVDTMLALFNVSGGFIDGNDDSTGLYSRISLTLTQDGTYYAVVSGYFNFNYNPITGTGTSPGDVGDYSITIELDAPEPPPEPRLFSLADDGTSSIVELDPVAGTELTRFAAPASTNGSVDGLAFDGTDLWFIGGTPNTLYQLDPDTGSVRDSDPIDAGVDGVTTLGGDVYLLDSGADVVSRFDPTFDVVVATLDLATINPGAGVDLSGGLASIAEPDVLLAVSSGQITQFDPVTGLVLGSFAPSVAAETLAVVNGELLVGPSSGSTLTVLDRTGVVLRTVTMPYGSLGLGGDEATAILPIGGMLTGTQWSDSDGDGFRDAGEAGLAGWTVYLDDNENGTLDPGERSTLTNAQGEYVFAGLPYGDYVIAQQTQANWLQTAPTAGSASLRLGGEDGSGGNGAGQNGGSIRVPSFSNEQAAAAESWVLLTAPGSVTAKTLAGRLGGTVQPAPVVEGAFVWTPDASRWAGLPQDRLSTVDAVDQFYPLVPQQQSKRAVPNDPLFVNQWHLRNTGQNGGTAGQDANIVGAWDTVRGTGVTIAIVDDGLQHTHPDLNDNYIAAASFDINGNDPDPSPVDTFDRHGTSAAGVAAANGFNSLGVTGSAPNANLSGLRLIAGPSDDADEAFALTFAGQINDIYSNSWGPFDSPAATGYTAPGPLTRAALQSGVENGRGGLGSIYVWAAGNGLGNNDNVNYDGYANSRYTIAVSAIDHNGRQSNYSEPGSPILVAAYSSGLGPGITTTDLTGSLGYSSGDYNSGFGGTSSATPLVSGVIALMLEANPNLTWRDVQLILANTAAQNDPGDVDWSLNGAGRLINHKYGFGVIDAGAAVDAAVNWQTVAPEISVTSGTLNTALNIPNNNSTGVSTTATVNQDVRIETVEIEVDLDHGNSGDLEFVLTSPAGTQSILATANASDVNDLSWTFTTLRHLDESAVGEWTLTVRDRASGSAGSLVSWRLNFYGTATDPEITPGDGVWLVGNLSNGVLVDGLDFGNQIVDAQPPAVSGAFLHSTQWTPAIVDIFDGGSGDGMGSGNGIGMAMTAGMLVANAGMDQITIQFSEEVVGFNAANVRLLGVARADYASLMTSVTFDPVSHRGTITLREPLNRDRLRVAVNDAVTDVAGNPLNGDGDGSQGGIFDMLFNVLVGDGDANGTVTSGDLTVFIAASGSTFGVSANYDLNADWNGNGTVTSGDLLVFAVNSGLTLPNGTPASATFGSGDSSGSGSGSGSGSSGNFSGRFSGRRGGSLPPPPGGALDALFGNLGRRGNRGGELGDGLLF